MGQRLILKKMNERITDS